MNTEQHPLITHLRSQPETLTSFARRVGMSRMQLYRIMNGEGTTTDSLKRICAATNGAVPIAAFFSEQTA